jgi:hypothetical protein
MTKKKGLKIPKKMFIFCEGEKTEPYYINDYIEDCCPIKAKVITIADTKKNTPVQLVDEAIKKKKDRSTCPGDEFWVVYDRESKAKYPMKKHDEAWNKAKANGINIAMSNVCFEMWILLHFCYTEKPFSSYDNLIAESNLKDCLAKVGIHKYDKGDNELYAKIKHGIKRARCNAKRLNYSMLAATDGVIDGTKGYLYDCYVDMYRLLDAIDELN